MRAALVFGGVIATVAAVATGCSYPDAGGAVPCKGNCGGSFESVGSVEKDAGDVTLVPEPSEPSSDAGSPSATCSPSAPFGEAKLVSGIDPDIFASSPHLTPDERVVFFTGKDPTLGSQIMRASRTSREQPFGPAEEVPGINSASNDNDPTVSSDGLTLAFHSGRSGDNDVWWAKRADISAEFGAPTAAPGIATTAYEGQAFFHVAADELWFVSNRGGDYDIFRAKLEGGTFGAAVNVAELNSPLNDFLPFLSQDGRTIVFSSTREGTKGGQDLYIATRSDPNGAFGSPAPIDELNTTETEQAGSLSPDGCRIYFSRAGSLGGQQLFVAERPLPQ